MALSLPFPLLVVLPLLALPQHGEAIRCFVCSSQRDPGCKDPFTSAEHGHMLTHCNQENTRNVADIIPGLYTHYAYGSSSPQSEEFVCVKAVTREYDREVVVRSCSIPRADTFNVCSQLKSKDLSFCQTCDHDSCNAAVGLGPAPGYLAMALLPPLALIASASTR